MPQSATDEDRAKDRLFEEAMDLVIRFQNDPESPITSEMIALWCARSLTHEQAWAEVAEIHGMAGKVLKDRNSATKRAKVGLTRRNLMIGAGVGFGAYAAGKLIIPDLLLAARADHLTETAEIRRVSLADGSQATLGPNSAIAHSFSANERRIELLAGMCYFEVAKGERPFHVAADGMTATAHEAAFNVSNDDGYLTVSVGRGGVDVQMSTVVLAGGETINAGHWLTAKAAASSVERGPRDLSQIASWRDGLIAAEREAVSAVVARIARWQHGRTILMDRALGSRRVNGVYDITQPTDALKAVVHPFGGKVRQISTYLTVISSF